jgi:hypothetical protein
MKDAAAARSTVTPLILAAVHADVLKVSDGLGELPDVVEG